MGLINGVAKDNDVAVLNGPDGADNDTVSYQEGVLHGPRRIHVDNGYTKDAAEDNERHHRHLYQDADTGTHPD